MEPYYSRFIPSSYKQIQFVPLLVILNINTCLSEFLPGFPIVKILSFTFVIDSILHTSSLNKCKYLVLHLTFTHIFYMHWFFWLLLYYCNGGQIIFLFYSSFYISCHSSVKSFTFIHSFIHICMGSWVSVLFNWVEPVTIIILVILVLTLSQIWTLGV